MGATHTQIAHHPPPVAVPRARETRHPLFPTQRHHTPTPLPLWGYLARERPINARPHHRLPPTQLHHTPPHHYLPAQATVDNPAASKAAAEATVRRQQPHAAPQSPRRRLPTLRAGPTKGTEGAEKGPSWPPPRPSPHPARLSPRRGVRRGPQCSLQRGRPLPSCLAPTAPRPCRRRPQWRPPTRLPPGRRRGALFVLFRTDGDGLGPVAASVDNHVGGGPSGPRRCLPPRGPQRREQRRRWKWRPPPRPQRLPAAPAGCPRRQPLPRGRPKQLPPRPGRRPRRRAARLR